MTHIAIQARGNGRFVLPAKEMNEILEVQHISTMLPYQQIFRPFDFMQKNQKGKAVRTKVNVKGMLWQPHSACGSSPSGRAVLTSTEADLCALDMNFVMCSELFGTCLEHVDNYGADGTVSDDFIAQVLPQIANQVSNNSASSLLNILFMGGYYTRLGKQPITAMPNEDREALMKLEPHCKGLLSHLNDTIEPCNVFGNEPYSTCTSLADFSELLERFMCCARDKSPLFASILDTGFNQANGIQPIIISSNNLSAALQRIYRGYAALSNPQQYSPLTREQFTVNGTTVWVYLWNNIPIIPVAAINGFDPYYKTTTEFLAMTVTGNIELFTNYQPESVLGVDEPVAVNLYRNPDPAERNNIKVSSTALIGVNVKDPELLVYDVAVFEN